MKKISLPTYWLSFFVLNLCFCSLSFSNELKGKELMAQLKALGNATVLITNGSKPSSDEVKMIPDFSSKLILAKVFKKIVTYDNFSTAAKFEAFRQKIGQEDHNKQIFEMPDYILVLSKANKTNLLKILDLSGKELLLGSIEDFSELLPEEAKNAPSNPSVSVKTGEIVYPLSYQNGWAKIMGINYSKGNIVVLGNHSSTYDVFPIDSLAVTGGCLNGFCVGQTVFPFEFSRGSGKIVAINYHQEKLIVVGNLDNKNHIVSSDQLASDNRGCFDEVCVDSKVYPLTFERGYGIVKAYHQKSREYIIEGDLDGKLIRLKKEELAFAKGCLSSKICVGSKVLPESYERGFGTVVAISSNKKMAVVKGNFDEKYSVCSLEELVVYKE